MKINCYKPNLNKQILCNTITMYSWCKPSVTKLHTTELISVRGVWKYIHKHTSTHSGTKHGYFGGQNELTLWFRWFYA